MPHWRQVAFCKHPVHAGTAGYVSFLAAGIVAHIACKDCAAPPLQELAAQGKLPQGRGGHARGGAAEDPGVFREVPINDAPAELRHHLTKRPTQDDIARRTGTQIVTRGRYLPPGTQPAEGERPLHLHIAPGASATQVGAACLFPPRTLHRHMRLSDVQHARQPGRWRGAPHGSCRQSPMHAVLSQLVECPCLRGGRQVDSGG